MFGLLSKARKRRNQAALPPELVIAVDNIGVVWRSFHQSDTGDRSPRPLCMNFLGSRPFYLDDEEAVAKWIGKRYPELDEDGIERALRLVRDRVKALSQEARITDQLLTGRRRRGRWMSYTEDFEHLKL